MHYISKGRIDMKDQVYCMAIDGHKIDNILTDPTTNIVFNLLSGVRIEDLTEDEVKIMSDKFGENWKEDFAY
jgi:hypothetical protein